MILMRRAEPHELTRQAIPVITAHLTEAELAKWIPIRFDAINDPLQAPEPSLGALAELEVGGYVVLFYGKDSKQLTVELPATQNLSRLLASFLREVPLPISRILWRRKGTRLPKQRAAGRSATTKATASRKSAGHSGVPMRAKRSAMRVEAPAKSK